jgi:uncharacterized membrane protein
MTQQMKIVKEHRQVRLNIRIYLKTQLYNKSKSLNSREHEYNKKEENISLQSQPILIDLDGLDDWLNKANTFSKNNQLKQSLYHTETDNARKINFNLNNKARNHIVLFKPKIFIKF